MYQIDGYSVGATTTFPFNFTYYAQTLVKGPHTLSAVAQDDAGNSTQKSINFALQAEFDPPNFQWFDADPLNIKTGDFPRAFNLVPFRWEDTNKIDIYLSSSSSVPKLIYNFNHKDDQLFNNQLMFSWKHSPGVGEYVLKAILLDNSGRKVEKVLSVTVE